jgi:hypothetical protein
MSDDLQFALTCILLVFLRKEEIEEFLERYADQYDLLFIYLMRILPITTVSTEIIIPFIEKAWHRDCDDISLATILFNYYLSSGQDVQCQHIIPLLKSAVSSYPLAGVTLAKLALKQKDYSQALIYLNYVGQIIRGPVVDSCQSARSNKSTLICPWNCENGLFSSPWFEFFGLISEILRDVGSEEMKFFLNNNMGEVSEVIHRPSKRMHFRRHNGDDGELGLLFDPGIEYDDLEIKGLLETTCSIRFRDSIDEAGSCWLKRSKLICKWGRKGDELTDQLLLAVRTTDAKFVRVLFDDARKENLFRGIDVMLLLKAAILELGVDLNEIMRIGVQSMTVMESRIWELMRRISESINRLEKET